MISTVSNPKGLICIQVLIISNEKRDKFVYHLKRDIDEELGCALNVSKAWF